MRALTFDCILNFQIFVLPKALTGVVGGGGVAGELEPHPRNITKTSY